MIETILLFTNEWLILNRIISVGRQYLKKYNCVKQMNSGLFKNILSKKQFT